MRCIYLVGCRGNLLSQFGPVDRSFEPSRWTIIDYGFWNYGNRNPHAWICPRLSNQWLKVSTFSTQCALSALTEVYLSCLMCLDRSVWLLCWSSNVLSYHSFIWHQMSNNGTQVEMPQLSVHHSCTADDTQVQSLKLKRLNEQTECLCGFRTLWHSILNVLVTYYTLQECWQTVENVGGQLVSSGPAMHLHLPESSAHVRFTEHGSMPSYLPAQRLLARRVRGWRMRWQLHVSISGPMTHRSFLWLTLLSSI